MEQSFMCCQDHGGLSTVGAPPPFYLDWMTVLFVPDIKPAKQSNLAQ